MKKILLNGADAPRYGLEFGHSMQDHFQILVGADGGRVSCMVADGKENPVVGASVRLFAAEIEVGPGAAVSSTLHVVEIR